MPRIERLQQNTAEWHRWRRQGLGASDAPVIMGDAAFKTPRMQRLYGGSPGWRLKSSVVRRAAR